jgi:hypothetical protein
VNKPDRKEWLNVTLKEGAQILGESLTRLIHNELVRMFNEWPVHKRPDRILVEVEDAGLVIFDNYGVTGDDDVKTAATLRFVKGLTIV